MAAVWAEIDSSHALTRPLKHLTKVFFLIYLIFSLGLNLF